MSSFNETKKIEQIANKRLLPFIERHADRGHYTLTDKGRHSSFLQKMFGDVMANFSAELVTIELKAEERWTGNLFLETWSNLNFQTKGWMATSKSDLLLYYFINRDWLGIYSLPSLQEWFFGNGDLPANSVVYEERRQNKRFQLNDTWGCCVPISTLRNLKPRPREVVVSQLGLFDEIHNPLSRMTTQEWRWRDGAVP